MLRPEWLHLTTALRQLEDLGVRTPCTEAPALFVSEEPAERRLAVHWCADCPVRVLCGAYADAASERWYVWGGRDRSPRPIRRGGRS